MAATTTRKASTSNAKAPAKGKAKADNVFSKLGRAHGAETRVSLSESEAAHTAYAKANDKAQQAARHDYVNAFLAAHLSVSPDIADTLRQAPRFGAKDKVDGDKTIKARTKVQQQAYDRARKWFGFHIARDDNRLNGGGNKPAKVRADLEVQAAIQRLCSNLFRDGLTVLALDTVRDQIAAMRPAIVKAEKDAAKA